MSARRICSLFMGVAGLVAALTLSYPGRARAVQGAPAGKKETISSEACASCHDKTVEGFKHTAHIRGSLSCENCHSGAQAHVDSDGKSRISTPKQLSPEASSALCLSCHAKGNQTHWASSTHNSRKLACVSCHDPHPKGTPTKALLSKPQFELCTSCHLQKKAALLRSGHMPMREGKMECTSCHNPHGTPNDKSLIQSSVNQNCYSCHAEKRGPFLYEHPPVRENCLNCHDPHGSLNDNLLRMKAPLLCQQCHIGTRHPGQLHTFKDRYAFNKGCVDCHPKIHGSTHPTGMRFWR